MNAVKADGEKRISKEIEATSKGSSARGSSLAFERNKLMCNEGLSCTLAVAELI